MHNIMLHGVMLKYLGHLDKMNDEFSGMVKPLTYIKFGMFYTDKSHFPYGAV